MHEPPRDVPEMRRPCCCAVPGSSACSDSHEHGAAELRVAFMVRFRMGRAHVRRGPPVSQVRVVVLWFLLSLFFFNEEGWVRSEVRWCTDGMAKV